VSKIRILKGFENVQPLKKFEEERSVSYLYWIGNRNENNMGEGRGIDGIIETVLNIAKGVWSMIRSLIRPLIQALRSLIEPLVKGRPLLESLTKTLLNLTEGFVSLVT